METFSHETLDPNWVTGFSDGQASFTYSRSGKQLALYFAIKLPAIDHAILEGIRASFGVGKIYDVKARAPTARTGATKTASYYRVTHREDLLRIVAHFDEFPLMTAKQRIYEIWRLMVLMKSQFRRPDRAALDELADSLSSRVGRNQSSR
ncbi:MAG: hypothetical protein H0V17_35850 [Deltaproteobacteria bacterium]|nr:hypothetical protein [Deltaproteobacteria bacterium]